MRSCHNIASLLLAEPDGTLSAVELARLETHVGACAECRRQRAILAAAPRVLREATAAVPVPNVREAWSELRAHVRSDRAASPTKSSRWSLPQVTWGLRFAGFSAAAAFALIAFVRNPADVPLATQPATLARADFVQAENAASTLVYVDQESGWLIVWADSKAASEHAG